MSVWASELPYDRQFPDPQPANRKKETQHDAKANYSGYSLRVQEFMATHPNANPDAVAMFDTPEEADGGNKHAHHHANEKTPHAKIASGQKKGGSTAVAQAAPYLHAHPKGPDPFGTA